MQRNTLIEQRVVGWLLLAGAIALAGVSLSTRAAGAEGTAPQPTAAAPKSGTAAPPAGSLVSPAKVTNVVLVHGAWADGSSWSGVIQRLQKASYQTTAAQLALASLDDDVARVREVLALQSGPTILVAHSYAGAVVTQLGPDAPNVVGIVYESAFAPDQGETLKAITGASPPPPGAAAIRPPDSRGFIWLDPAGFLQYFAPDVDKTKARVMAAAQKPIAAGAFASEGKLGPPAWKSFPTWYLVSEKDLMIPPAAQHMFAKRMGATVSSIAGSHVLMVSHPDEVAAFIIKAAQGVSKKAAHAEK